MQLNESECWTVQCALRIAAEQYKRDAASVAHVSAAGDHLAAQFYRQERDALALIAKLEAE